MWWEQGGVSLTRCWSWDEMWWHCLAERGECHSQAVGHGMKCDETRGECHSLAVGYGMRLPGKRKGCVTHKLLVMGWNVMRLPGRKGGECHSLAVGHGRKCDEIAWPKMGGMSLTSYCHGMRCDEIAWQRNRGSVTHKLLVIGWNVMTLLGRKMGGGTHSLLFKEWNLMKLPGRKGGSITHSLLFMGGNVMRLPGTEKGSVSLTSCWSWHEIWWESWDCLAEKGCHLLPVGHGMKCDEIAWQSVTHFLLVKGWNVMTFPGRKELGVSLTSCRS